jgi:hypothetical protein
MSQKIVENSSADSITILTYPSGELYVNPDLTLTGLTLSALTVTESTVIPNTVSFVKFSNADTGTASTLSIKAGRLYYFTQTGGGTAGHSITLTAGTFDGTNDVATLNADYETLVVFGIADDRGIIINNTGEVAMTIAS